jgi:hypothetical protein
MDRLGPLSLCYRTEDDGHSEPLTDIEVLITERRRSMEEKEVLVLPSGYKIVSNNPIPHTFLTYKRSTNTYTQCADFSNRPSNPCCSKESPKREDPISPSSPCSASQKE